MEKKTTAKKPTAKTSKEVKAPAKKTAAKKPAPKKAAKKPVEKIDPVKESLDGFRSIVKAIRIGKGISEKKLAEMAKVSPHTITGIENGTSIPKLDSVIKIFDALGYTMDVRLK